MEHEDSSPLHQNTLVTIFKVSVTYSSPPSIYLILIFRLFLSLSRACCYVLHDQPISISFTYIR